ncbi:hypothetical protein, partial [Escherichia coli]
LDNLLFDGVDDRGEEVPFVDPGKMVAIETRFDALDRGGALPYPLIAVELRYYNKQADEDGIRNNLDGLGRVVSNLVPAPLDQGEIDRLIAENEHVAAVLNTKAVELEERLVAWEKSEERKREEAEDNRGLAEQLVADARLARNYAIELRA